MNNLVEFASTFKTNMFEDEREEAHAILDQINDSRVFLFANKHFEEGFEAICEENNLRDQIAASALPMSQRLR